MMASCWAKTRCVTTIKGTKNKKLSCASQLLSSSQSAIPHKNIFLFYLQKQWWCTQSTGGKIYYSEYLKPICDRTLATVTIWNMYNCTKGVYNSFQIYKGYKLKLFTPISTSVTQYTLYIHAQIQHMNKLSLVIMFLNPTLLITSHRNTVSDLAHSFRNTTRV